MMQGTVTAQHEAMLAVELLSPDQRRQQIEVLIDTGFNGSLILPAPLIQHLALPFVGYRRARLGDGRVVVFKVYIATVWWHEQRQEVLVLEAEGGALLGMALLAGNRVTLDVVEHGAVHIEQFPAGAQG